MGRSSALVVQTETKFSQDYTCYRPKLPRPTYIQVCSNCRCRTSMFINNPMLKLSDQARTLEECQLLCDGNHKCDFVSYSPSKKKCYSCPTSGWHLSNRITGEDGLVYHKQGQ